MKNFSEIDIKTNKEQVINLACSQTGLSEDIVSKIYESEKLNNRTDNEIIKYFETCTVEKQQYTTKEFIESISTVLSEVSLNDDNKNELTKKFLSVLSDVSVNNNIDTITLLEIINNVLVVKDPKAKDKLIPILSLNFVDNDQPLKKLNESFNMALNTDNSQNTVFLFEGLKEILNKNNRRWGLTYHITNSYNAIMSYIDSEIEEIALNSKMYSVTNEYHNVILNDMLSGSVSPLYKHVSSVKTLVPDLQTLVFDMVLLVNKYFQAHDSALEYVNRQTFNDYNDSGNLLIKSIISSLSNSSLISPEIKRKYLVTPENNSKNSESLMDFGKTEADSVYYGDNDNVLLQLSQYVNSNNLKYNVWNISLKSVVDMINFIKSSSMEFNLKIRPIMRTYITKSYLLASSVEKADLLRKKASGY